MWHVNSTVYIIYNSGNYFGTFLYYIILFFTICVYSRKLGIFFPKRGRMSQIVFGLFILGYVGASILPVMLWELLHQNSVIFGVTVLMVHLGDYG